MENKGFKVTIILLSLFCVFLIVGNVSLKELEDLFQEEIERLEESRDLSQEEIERLKRMDLFEFTPTLEDVKKVLREDKIEEVPYDDENFDCVEYAFGLIQSFFERKIYTCNVYLIFEDGAHSIVAVNTLDEGVIYIEPQEDKILFDLKVGDDYCKVMDWECEWTIIKIKSCFSEINRNAT